MPRKTKIIFITVFILVGVISLGFYLYTNKTTTSNSATDNQQYQPFLGGGTTQNTTNNTTTSGGDVGTTNLNTSSNTNTNPQIAQESSRFHKLTEFSVAGAAFFEDMRPLPTEEVSLPGGEAPTEEVPKTTTKKTKTVPKPAPPKFETVPSLRYVERATGHIEQMYLDTKATGEVSNSTIPNIYEAFFDSKASSVIYRYLDSDNKSITSFFATLGGTQGEFLPSNILDVSLSPDKTKFFYLTKTFSGVTGSTRSFNDTKKTQVFNSSITEWLSQWVTDQKIYLTTKASYSVDGSLFSLNAISGVLTKILGGIPGLTTLANSDGSLVLYSASFDTGPKLEIFNVKNHSSLDLNIYGLPEKCVWANNPSIIYCAIPNSIDGNQYPDSWYQGLVSFTDRFIKINSATNEITTIADSTYGSPIDGIHLFLDDKDSQLFFINKKDSTLWSLDLN